MEGNMGGSQDIAYLLRVLEDEVNGAKKTVFGGKVAVDPVKCLAVIGDIRFNLPKALAQAAAVVRERDNIIKDAKERAGQIVQDAEDKAATLVDNSEIIAKAKEDADYIVADAKSYAEFIKSESMKRLLTMLGNAEENLADILESVRDSRDDLEQTCMAETREAEAPRGRAGTGAPERGDYEQPRRGYEDTSRRGYQDESRRSFDRDIVFTEAQDYR